MKQIPMLNLRREYEYMKEAIDFAIERCLEHQKWILGPEVEVLEGKVADYLGVKHCIGVSSGTDAIVLSLRALAIKLKGEEYFSKEDEILTTPFTFTATGDAILRSRATPVFLDIDPLTYNIDPKEIEEYLGSAKTRKRSQVVGIVPVHLYGQACDMDKIMALADIYNLFVVEDVAQAFGGEWSRKKLGSIGTSGAFSFFPSKNLGGFGDGGMISTNDDEMNTIVRMLIKHGGTDKYNVGHIGYNARLDTLQAAVIVSKLKYLDEFNNRRRRIAEKYTQALQNIDHLSLPLSQSPASVHHVYHQYTIRTSKRDALQEHLKGKGISTMVYYALPLHRMAVFKNRMKVVGDLANTERASSEVLSLPIEPLQREDEIEFVTRTIKEFFTK